MEQVFSYIISLGASVMMPYRFEVWTLTEIGTICRRRFRGLGNRYRPTDDQFRWTVEPDIRVVRTTTEGL